MVSSQPSLHIGTSGWSYRHWREAFYPRDMPSRRWFEHYQTVFASVELNAPFYRLPSARTVEQWASTTAPDFVFAVKGSRFLTHNKKLKDPEDPLRQFFEVLDGLGGKMAVVLWQLPPIWKYNPERLDRFLVAFREREGTRRVCFEFRNPTWYDSECLAILRRHDAGFCIYDLAGHTSPMAVTSDFVYLRLHGPTHAKYTGEYGRDGLQSWVERIRAWRKDGREVFVYFDNDGGAAAVRDAMLLKDILTIPVPDQVGRL